MKKIFAAFSTLLIDFFIFAVLWNSTFSIISENDKWFFIAFVIIFVIFTFIFFKSKKNFIPYILSAVFCIMTLTSLLIYRNWNKQGFEIKPDRVDYIEYYTSENDTTYIYNDINSEQISNFIELYNSSNCIKRWDNGGRIGTPEKYIRIFLTDTTKVVIEEDGCIDIAGKTFKTTLTLKELLEQLETNNN